MATFTSLAAALEAEVSSVRALVVDANSSEAWTAWPEDLWRLEDLEVLRLNQPRARLPSAIRALRRLRVLEVSHSIQFVEAGIAELRELRELTLGCAALRLPREVANLTLDRLTCRGAWDYSMELVARIPVRVNVTLVDGHPRAADELEALDLPAWRALEELEIDAFEDFEPTGFERKLPRCGFAINRKRKVDWTI